MVSLACRMAFILAAVLALIWSVELRGVQQDFGKGESTLAAPGIHDVTSSDIPGFRMMIGGGVIDVNSPSGALDTPSAAVHNWISASACAVTTYYGCFPVKRLDLLVVPV